METYKSRAYQFISKEKLSSELGQGLCECDLECPE